MPVATQLKDRIFHQFFPPPKFLEMPAVGLDISDTAVTALELVRQRGAFAVGRFGRRLLPAGAIVDGYVYDKEGVVAELRTLKEELRLSFVNGSLPEEKAYLYTTRMPPVSPKEMRGVIEFTLEENVPLSPAEAIFDYTVIPSASSSSPDSREVSVTAFPRAVVHTYAELFQAAGLILLSLELGAQAVCRAVISHGDRGTYLVVHRGAEKTGLFIVRDETVHFTAIVAMGTSGTREALRAEVGRIITYWQTHAGGSGESVAGIGKIVLCGAGATSPGLRESLARALSLPVEDANVWRNAFSFDAYIPPILFEESLLYAAAVGLALPKGN